MEIGQLIEDSLHKNGVSKTHFAKNLEVSKSYLLRVINGEKPCSENLFSKIMNSTLLPKEDKALISDEFFSNEYGLDNFKKIKHMIRCINDYNIVQDKEYYLRRDVFDTLFKSNEPFTIGNHMEFIEIVHYFLDKSQNGNPEKFFFYSNFCFEQQDLNDFLLYFFSQTKLEDNLNMDFVHNITIAPIASSEDISVVLKIHQWAHFGYKTYCKVVNTVFDSAVFPYFIITNDAVIIFDRGCNQGIALTDKRAIDYYVKNFNNTKNEFISCIHQYEDELNFMYYLDNAEYTIDSITLDGFICIGPLLNYDLLKEVASDDLPEPQKDYLINEVIEHYRIYSGTNTGYSSMRSLRAFADTGDYIPISKKYMKYIPVKWRIYLFNKMIEIVRHRQKSGYEASDNYPKECILRFNIIDDNKLLLPNNISFDATTSSLITNNIVYDTKSDGSLLTYNYVVEINSKSLSNFYNIFVNYLQKAGYLCSDDTVIRLLEECILRAKRSEHIDDNC